MFSLIRLSRILLRRRWGWYILGTILAIVGISVGATSHTVAYQTVSSGSFTPNIVDNGTDYLQLNNGSTYYVINESDFTPTFNGATFFKQSVDISLIARTDSQSVDVSLTDGSHLQGDGYTVEQIVLLNSNGQPQQTYTSSEYTQNPHGFYENDWIGGGALLVLGLIAVGLGFFVPQRIQKRQRRATNVATATAGPQGSAPAYPPTNPYASPYGTASSPTAYTDPSQYQAGSAYAQSPIPIQPYGVQNPQPNIPNIPYQAPSQFSPYEAQPHYPVPQPYPPQSGAYDQTQLADPSGPQS